MGKSLFRMYNRYTYWSSQKYGSEKRLDNILEEGTSLEKLFVLFSPSVKMEVYINRIVRYMHRLDTWVFALAFLYIDKLQKRRLIRFCFNTEHKLLAVALCIAYKYHLGQPYDYTYTSKVVGIRPDSLMELELAFLDAIEWKLYVPYHKLEQFIIRVLINDYMPTDE